MPDIDIETPIGKVVIPFNEEIVLELFRKINKVQAGAENTLEDHE